MELNMEELQKIHENVLQLTADKSRLTVLMNECKVLANGKGREPLNKDVSIKELESEVMKRACESTEKKGTVQNLEILNQEIL